MLLSDQLSCSPYIGTSSLFIPFTGARHEGPEECHKRHHRYNSARDVNHGKLFEGVEHTKVVARQCQSDSLEHQS